MSTSLPRLEVGMLVEFEGRVLASEEAVAARPALPKSVCAWCDAEQGIKPSMEQIQSHGICPQHHAKVKAEIAALQAAYDAGDL